MRGKILIATSERQVLGVVDVDGSRLVVERDVDGAGWLADAVAAIGDDLPLRETTGQGGRRVYVERRVGPDHARWLAAVARHVEHRAPAWLQVLVSEDA